MKSIQKQSKKISWNDISQFQSSLFNVFLKYEKDIWPQKAWSAMAKAGLNEYVTFMDKQRVLLRFMTIATLYNEFCDLAFNINFDRIGQTFEWIQQGVINRLQLWEFIQFNYDYDINDYDDLNMCLIEITCDIIDSLRYEVRGGHAGVSIFLPCARGRARTPSQRAQAPAVPRISRGSPTPALRRRVRS